MSKRPPSQAPVEVLIVDDDDDFTFQIEEYLKSMNFTVQCASNGTEALKLLEIRDYDVILTDINMPVMDGMTFFNKLSDRFPRLIDRFIFITGALDMKTMTFMKDSCRPFILKPFEFSDLIREVDTIIGPR